MEHPFLLLLLDSFERNMQISSDENNNVFTVGSVMSMDSGVEFGSDGSQDGLGMSAAYEEVYCVDPEFGCTDGQCLCDPGGSFEPMFHCEHAGPGSPTTYCGLSCEHQEINGVDNHTFAENWIAEPVFLPGECDGATTQGCSEWVDDIDIIRFDSPATPENMPALSRSSSTSQSSRDGSPVSDLSSSQSSSPPCRRSPRTLNGGNNTASTSPPTSIPRQAHPRPPHSKLSYPSQIRKQREMSECDFPGCGKTFTRWDDRERHQNSKHGKAKAIFYCVHCDGSGKSRGFLRKDKVRSHWKNIHEKHGLEFDFRRKDTKAVEPMIVEL